MFPTYTVLSAALVLIASFIFWEAHVPPMPPASQTETKRQIPWIRLHGITIAVITITFMWLTAAQLLLGEGASKLIKIECAQHPLRNSLHLSPGVAISYMVLIVGGTFRIKSQRALGKYFTWEIGLKPDHKLCTSGPYSFVRHPSYLGLWIVRLAVDIIHSSQGNVLTECIAVRYPLFVKFFVWEGYVFTLALIIWMSFRAKWEDELMQKEFGVVWTNWAKKTPYRVVPYIY